MWLNRCDVDGNIRPYKKVWSGPAYTRIRMNNREEAKDIEVFSRLWTPIKQNQRYTYFVVAGELSEVDKKIRGQWRRAMLAVASELS